jgi:hypothetical protein
MKQITIHVPRCYKNFVEYITAAEDSLIKFGFDVDKLIYRRNSPPDDMLVKSDFVFYLADRSHKKHKDKINVFIETDHKELELRKDFPIQYDEYTRSIHWFDYKENLQKKNIYYCPIGYHKTFDTDIKKQDLRDNLFIGRITNPRECFLKNFKFVYNPGDIFGRKRDELIITSKININYRLIDDYWFTPLHAALILFKGKLLLQDEYNKDDYGWMKPYLIFFNDENFQDVYNYWLTHDKERREFEDYIYTEVKKHMFEDYFYKAVGDLLEQYRRL